MSFNPLVEGYKSNDIEIQNEEYLHGVYLYFLTLWIFIKNNHLCSIHREIWFYDLKGTFVVNIFNLFL